MISSFNQLATLTTAAAAAAGGGGGFLGQLVILVPLFGLMYFLIIRPQKQKQKEQQEMLQTLKAGDRVMTSGGAIGIIRKVSDKTVHITFAERVEIEFVRSAVASILPEKDADDLASNGKNGSK